MNCILVKKAHDTNENFVLKYAMCTRMKTVQNVSLAADLYASRQENAIVPLMRF
jgi:type III secretory pathway component EscU